MLRLYEKRLKVCFLKFVEPRETFSNTNHQLSFVAKSSDKAKSSLFYTIFSSYEPNFKTSNVAVSTFFRPTTWTGWMADDLHKKSTQNRYLSSSLISFDVVVREMLTSDYHFKRFTNIIKASVFNTEQRAGFQSHLITRLFANYLIFIWCEQWSVKSASYCSMFNWLRW